MSPFSRFGHYSTEVPGTYTEKWLAPKTNESADRVASTTAHPKAIGVTPEVALPATSHSKASWSLLDYFTKGYIRSQQIQGGKKD